MKLMIRHKILILAALSAFLPIIVILILTITKKNTAEETLSASVEEVTRRNIAQLAKDVYSLCRLGNDLNPNSEEVQEFLKEEIKNIVVGKTGYVYILGGQGDHRGEYILSKDRARDGENIYNAKDADGRLFIQSVVAKGIKLGPGDVDF